MHDTEPLAILVVEDNADLAANIADYLEDRGHLVDTALDGVTGLHLSVSQPYDVIVLDLMLPGMVGLTVCRKLRQEANLSVPVLMLTARATLDDKEAGFAEGADDYMTKPFSLRELEARLKSVLRRTRSRGVEKEESDHAPIIRGNLRIDSARREVTISGRAVDLTPKEFELLSLFASHPGRVYSRKFLLENIWDYTYSGYDRTIDSHINRLRAKIEDNPDDPKLVKTVWGVGYKFADENEE